LPLGELPANHIVNLKLIEWLAHSGQYHHIRTSRQCAASAEENHRWEKYPPDLRHVYILLSLWHWIHLAPSSGTSLHVGIVAGGVVAIIPIRLWWRRLDIRLGRWLNVHWRRRDNYWRIHIWHPERDHDPWDDHHGRRSITIITIRAIPVAPIPIPSLPGECWDRAAYG
jgi:hypothetical protein